MISSEFLFSCTQCGQCCKGFGGTYVTPEEQTAIAAFLGIPTLRFVKQYCVPSGRKLVLAQGSEGSCIFYRENCSIHPVKPRMCRRWPFIDALVVDISNWHAMADSCPGMRTDVDDKTLRLAVEGLLQQEKSLG